MVVADLGKHFLVCFPEAPSQAVSERLGLWVEALRQAEG
jgi:hypothetical protein